MKDFYVVFFFFKQKTAYEMLRSLVGSEMCIRDRFLYAVLPQDNSELRTLASQRPNYEVDENEYLTYDIEYTLSKLIDTEISLGNEIEFRGSQLHLDSDFTLIKAFNSIDVDRNGALEFNNIKQFLKDCNVLPFEEEVICLIRRLDIDDDGKINLDEFSDRLKPKSFLPRPLSPKRTFSPKREILADQTLVSPSIKFKIENSPAKRPSSRYTSPVRYISKPSSPPRTTTYQSQYESPLRQKQNYFSANSTAFTQRRTGSPGQASSILKSQRSPPRSTVLRSPPRATVLRSPPRATALRSPPRFSSPSRQALRSPTRVASPYQETLRQTLRSSSRSRRSPRRVITPEKSVSFGTRREQIAPGSIRKGAEYQSPKKATKQVSDQINFALRQLVTYDREVELIRQDLALRPDFNLLDGFRVLDREGRGSVSAGEIELALNELSIFPTKDELYLFTRKYDTDNDGRLRYSDFAEAFTPFQSEYQQLLTSRAPKGVEGLDDPIDVFSLETRRVFIRAFRSLIENEVRCEQVRQELNKSPFFSIHEAFKVIDSDRDGIILPFELRNFLEDNDVFLTEKELSYLIDRFNVKGDGRITYSEFVQELTPKSTRF
eukprot:TRINITY_DN3334_c0_g1_i4.p1 TRINITY_DN3334_c0_g1~~TRINITY_DN3334_c0_g1_i4.p1  ORF type:complete len:605 (-),score=135.08 TRINITY_DN3334_c0_g1_i4:148-1962(-)